MVGRDFCEREVFALFGGQLRIQRQLSHADHAVHWCANLVAHVGQEFTLRPAGRFGRELGLAQFFFGSLVLGDVAEHDHAATQYAAITNRPARY